MALLNPSPVAPLPVTMWTTARLFASTRPLGVTDVLLRTSPPALRKPDEWSAVADVSSAATSHADVALKALQELQFVGSDEQGRLKWGPGHRPKDYATFCRQLREAVLAAENFEGVTDLKDTRGSRDLLRGLAWFLTKDPVAESWSWQQVYQDPTAGTDDETRIFVNSTRWNAFRYWAEALGFAEVATLSNQASGALSCDVTRAVRDVVLITYRKGEEVPVRALLTELRERLPVLPGGVLSRALGYAVSGEVVDKPTSYALEAGHMRGWLRLESRADSAEAIQLADLDKPGASRTVSHVVVQERIDV